MERGPGHRRKHRMAQAVGEHWSPGAQPWHHSSRLDDHFSLDPPECRHRLNRAVGKHGRSSAYYTHLSLRLHSHIRPARAERRQRTHCTLPAPRRHSTQSRRRIPWTKTAYRRPDPLSRHHTPWLDARTRMTLSGGCPIAHRAMDTYWRHRALNRITRCLPSIALLIISTRGERRSATWLSSTPRVPPHIFWGGCLSYLSHCLLISPPLSFRCLQLCFGAAIFPSLCPGSLSVQYLLPCPGVL